ncbi:unnamed protein product [Cladocopium goreaui]|uniref:CSD domain-containing protein n=1 Tax=Cladocopium goreaui TaxID=2562237 RepID=A0A9P1BZ28_9DINO|nr:unnamed protein product [Cladocopium goreaui]
MASQFSVRKVAQASGLFLLAATLVFAVADHQGLLTFGATHGKTTLSDSGAIAKAHEAKGTKVNASHTHKTKEKEAEKEECSNAVPGDPCYGAVLWHKWIGLIEQPYAYDGNLTRESDRHNIQSWLHEKGRSGCPRPCKESIAYPIPKVAHPGGPQIYCFSVARTGPEMDSMFMQRQTGTGIFACNGYDVYSDHEIDIDGYKTKLIPSTAAGVSVDRTAANSQVFMKTWMYILGSHWWYKYDFLAKVDPDAILFPERLRGHVAAHVGQNVFFLNCAVHAPAMYGAVEVFAKSALGAYQAAHGRCEQSLPFWSWGEDRFMQECLKMLGVIPIPDYTENVRDARCWGSDCGNKGAVAFHPFKAVNGWYRCYLASQ